MTTDDRGPAWTGSEIDYRLLFEESPDLLLILLPDAPRYTMVAATNVRLQVTHTTRETLGRGLFEVFPDNPDDVGATGTSNLRASLDRVVATRAPDTMAVQKYDIRGPDGNFQARYWSPRNMPVLSPTGDLTYIIHRVEDVTELVRASEAGEELLGRTREMEREVLQRSQELAAANRDLRDANAKLGELDVAKTAFFSNISHEFRTPLTLLLGPIEDSLSDAGEPPGPRQRARLELAWNNALRLLKLVNALLDFARLEAGRLRAQFAPLDAAAFTAELAGMFSSAVEKADLRLRIDCPPLTGPVWVDRDMWEKIVSNLVSNAFKFTLAGEIAVRMFEEDGRVVLLVSDTGVGIPEGELPLIFDRFHRVEGSTGRTFEGTGIGLALVRELVELHGGNITVESRVGEGSTFRVEIPEGFAHLPPENVSQEPADPTAGRESAAHAAEIARWAHRPETGALDPDPGSRPPGAAPEGIGPRATVLVVDDNADLREYISALLSPTCDVITAGDGQAALVEIRNRVPDIVVSDVMMPRLDGFGLLRALRENPETSSLPVILLSARAGEESAIEGLDAGSDDYLVKPFSARELLARVRTHVSLSRLRHELIRELENTNRELDSFSYSVSHDLRAPLRAISGFSEILLSDHAGQLDEAGQGHLRRIVNAADRMNELIDGLLALARTTRGEIHRERVDVTKIARETGERLAAADPGRRVELRVEDGLEADSDARLLGVVLDNLLGNAWKFTRKTSDARIDVGRTSADGSLAFFVRDNGAGFDMDYAARLFGAFQRLHTPEEFEGHGIGLATVQRIVHRLGGRVSAEGKIGAGATFTFTISSDKGRK